MYAVLFLPRVRIARHTLPHGAQCGNGSPRVAYLTVRSDNDDNVVPEDSAELAGARNVRLTGPIAPTHFTYPEDPTTFADVEAFILNVEHNAPPPPEGSPAATPTATPIATPYPGVPFSTTCLTNSQFSDVTNVNLAVKTPIPMPALDQCSGTVTFPASDSAIGSAGIVSWLFAPIGALAPADQPEPRSLERAGGPVLHVPSTLTGKLDHLERRLGNLSGRNIQKRRAPLGTCTNYYELSGSSTRGWQAYGPGVAVGAATSIAFPSRPNTSRMVLTSGETYYVGLVCF
jgi:hypothetical protein